jgi:hypothetical protein
MSVYLVVRVLVLEEAAKVSSPSKVAMRVCF